MATTTWAAIRAQFAGTSTARGVIEGITPTLMANIPFRRDHRNLALRDWAKRDSSCLRHFEWRRDGDTEVLSQGHGQDERMVAERAVLLVAYPVLEALGASDDIDGLEDLMRSDARQLHDCMFSPANLLSGMHCCLPEMPRFEMDGEVWFVSLSVRVEFNEAMSLTG